MDYPVLISNIIAFVALIVTVISVVHQRSVNASQKEVNGSQKDVNDLLLRQAEIQAQEARKAELVAEFTRSHDGKCKLMISNVGKVAARNLRVDIPDCTGLNVARDITAKSLEPGGSVSSPVLILLGARAEYDIHLNWDDDSSCNREKSISLTR